jgi:hypothetical protein
VLLGDVVELLEGRPERMAEVAEPVLRDVGRRMGGREVVIIPGNHDRALVRPWLRARGLPDAPDTAVPLDATPMLERVTSWLAPATVRVRYPGAWLAPGVWATHGHYLDRHLLPESAFGIARGLLGRQPRAGATPRDYEYAGGPSATRVEALLTRWLPRPLAALADDAAEALRAVTMPGLPLRARGHRMAPLTARLLGAQMQRAALPALAHVVRRLGVDAEWVIFGHVHRRGPFGADDAGRWRAPGDGPRIANTGSWVYEPLLLHRARAPHPYWPGGAIVIEDGADPRAVGLLDHLDASALH